MGKVFKMEVLKVLSLVMEANKETLGMVIQITEILYLLNVKSALEEVIQHQTVTLELITINHLEGS